MRRLLRRHLIVVPILWVASLLPLLLGASPAMGLSHDEEKAMGEEFLAQVRSYFEVLEDDFANQYINDLGSYLAQSLEIQYFPLHFYLIKNNTLNAFAGPGGHIFVFSGLIDAMEQADDLAAVVAHEIGHITARHLAQRLEQSKKIGIATLAGILAGILIGGPIAQAVMAGASAAGIQAQMAFSRDDERQADQLSSKIMIPATFDPMAMIAALQTIQKGSYLGTDKVPSYLLTHPVGPERMANIEANLRNYAPDSPKKEVIQFRDLYPYFQTVVRAESLEVKAAKRIFSGELSKNPEGDLPNFGMGLVSIQESDFVNAISYLKKAQAKKPDFLPILTHIGKAYELNGQHSEAIRILEQVLQKDNRDRSALYLLGQAYENSEQYEKALPFFEKLVYLAPMKIDSFYHLGICYGRMDKLGLAHYYFGVYHKALGQMQKAKFHFLKAMEFSRNDPALLSKIRIAREGIK